MPQRITGIFEALKKKDYEGLQRIFPPGAHGLWESPNFFVIYLHDLCCLEETMRQSFRIEPWEASQYDWALPDYEVPPKKFVGGNTDRT
jgi:hypothetical protein